LGAGLELVKNNRAVIVLEKDSQVGGLARTVNYKNYFFDIGGHRFFSKNKEITDLWRKLLGKDLIERRRLSRIYYNKKFFNYPLKPLNAFLNMGVLKTIHILCSFLWVRLKQLVSQPEEKSFSQWVTNRFGAELFKIFFKTYTEKVWGLSTDEIGAEWAAQRIKGLSLSKAVLDAFGFSKKGQVKTLIDKFNYPRLGPGMMFEKFQAEINKGLGQVNLNCELIELIHDNGHILKAIYRNAEGDKAEAEADDFISSIPITVLMKAWRPAPPQEVMAAASQLMFRSFITLILILNKREVFPDNWLYIHSPEVKVGRLQNFKNWSAEMVPDQSKTSLGLEYFCSPGDDLWNKNEAEFFQLAKEDIIKLNFAQPEEILDYTIVRMKEAYPIYQLGYQEQLRIITNYLKQFRNLQLIGRGGMFRYNNMDHSILSGIYAARNLLGAKYDLWQINADAEYLEEENNRN